MATATIWFWDLFIRDDSVGNGSDAAAPRPFEISLPGVEKFLRHELAALTLIRYGCILRFGRHRK
ncbi:MAG: hypothetical protein CMM08_14345 [Rhodospirillaceae bacterium]|nr:hypothetical protein [Rhodospirillaceae bacterium]